MVHRKSYTAILRDKRPGNRKNAPVAEWLTATQGTLWIVLGIWPLAHLISFVGLTGLEMDPWALRTIGALQISIGGVLLMAALRSTLTLEIGFLLMGSSLAMGLGYLESVWLLAEDYFAILIVLESLLMAGLALAFLSRFMRRHTASFLRDI